MQLFIYYGGVYFKYNTEGQPSKFHLPNASFGPLHSTHKNQDMGKIALKHRKTVFEFSLFVIKIISVIAWELDHGWSEPKI